MWKKGIDGDKEWERGAWSETRRREKGGRGERWYKTKKLGNLNVSLPFRNIVSVHLARCLRIYGLVIDRKEHQTARATSVRR